jgi:hypothetical protein
MNSDLEILIAALHSAGDAGALDRVRARADAIRDALDDDDIDLGAARLEYLDQHREWVGEVYAALGDDAETGEDSEDSEIARAIQEVRANEATEIGEAFAALMQLLAESHHDWKKGFELVRYPDPDSPAWTSLLKDPSVIAAKQHGYQLIAHTGLTPSLIYEATRGLHLLFERVVDSMAESPKANGLKRLPAHETVFRVLAGESAAPIPYELVHAEIAGTPDIPEHAVEPLCNWISEVLAVQPFLIEGYFYNADAERRGFEQLAQLDFDFPDDLIAQWSQQDRRTPARRRAARVGPGASRRTSY